MKTRNVVVAGLAVATNTAAISNKPSSLYSFQPESAKTIWDGRIPVVYTFNETQLNNYSGSWWSSSFLTGCNSKQYFVVSHFLAPTADFSFYRASFLDLDSLEYSQFVTVGNGITDISLLNVTIDDNGFESLSNDNISKLRTYSNYGNVTFDITWESTSSIIANAGSGVFTFGTGLTYEWGLPACRTEGTITVEGEKIAIDTANSFTWYDRQLVTGDGPSTGNWTWFELHIPNTGYKMSVWAIDNTDPYQASRFATIRAEDGSLDVVPIIWTPKYSRAYYSHATGFLYALDWTVTVGDVGSFSISSILADQEIVGADELDTAYEGFVTFTGEFYDKKVSGYGVVEVVFNA